MFYLFIKIQYPLKSNCGGPGCTMLSIDAGIYIFWPSYQIGWIIQVLVVNQGVRQRRTYQDNVIGIFSRANDPEIS